MGIFQPPVSRFTVAMVDKHWGANTNHANNDSAVAKLHCCAMMGIKALALSLADADKAYTVAKELTATSLAAMPGTKAKLICQLKPIGSSIKAKPRPI